MNSDKLMDTFLEDARTFTERLGALALQLEKEPGNPDLLEQAFRAAHSLKSEASYMDYQGLTRSAHELETVFQSLRNGEIEPDGNFLDRLLESVDSLAVQVGNLESRQPGPSGGFSGEEAPGEKGDDEDGSSATEEADAGAEEDGFFVEEPSEDSRGLSLFEQTLLREAARRGELFYRIVCELDDDLPMRYAKAYLIINNLELIVNVIRVSPGREILETGEFGELEILFTSGVSEKDIFQAVNLDQVRRVQLTPLRFQESFLAAPVRPAPEIRRETLRETILKVEAGKIDRLQAFVDELRFLTAGQGDDRAEFQGILAGMDGIIKEIRMVPASEVFGGFPRLVRDMGRNAGKELEFRLTGGETRIDRWMVQLLVEPLTHLIRNAVDHGIESPQEREGAGKCRQGLIELIVSQAGESLTVRLRDDGRGIRREDVLERAEEMGLYDREERELLHYLIQPGFSTVDHPTALSGRGLGLDLISRTIKQTGRGRISMDTRPGEGTEFLLEVPRGYSPMRLLIFRSGDQVFTLPGRDVTEVRALEPADFRQDESGYLFYRDMPVYTPLGRLVLDGPAPEEKLVLILNHLGRQTCLLAGEILFETDIPQENYRLGRELAPHQFEFYLGEKKAEYLYLNPTLFA